VFLCAAGILGPLVLYGILQERIMTRPYVHGRDGDYFKHSLLIVLLNRLLTCLAALATHLVKRERIRPLAPISAYALVSFSNVVATSCQYEALKHVSFPVQTLAKTAKTVPVMLWGATMLRKRYTPSEYALAALVTSGCTLFLVSGESAATVEVSTGASSGGGSAAWGGALMAAYLGFDGFTSTFQERLYRGRLYRGGQEMTPHHQVLFVTAFSCALALVSLATSGALGPALSFVLDHPACLWDMLLISSTAVTSQFAIAYTIKTYGALVFVAIMTTRQLVSILVSKTLFRHPMQAGQWLGLLVVFGTLYAKIKVKGRKPSLAVPDRKHPRGA